MTTTTLKDNGKTTALAKQRAKAQLQPQSQAQLDLDFNDQDMMTVMMFMVMILLMQQLITPIAQSTSRYILKQSYVGNIEAKIVDVTDAVQYWDFVGQAPYTPLISVFLVNKGANNVYVAINATQDWMELWPNETRIVDNTGADRRIEIIFYKCSGAGRTSFLEIEGQY